MPESPLCQVHGTSQCRRFVHGLLEFHRRVRVQNDSGSGLEIDGPLPVDLFRRDDDCSKGKSDVRPSAEADRTDPARIRTTPGWFDLIDDLHRTDLGGATDCADRQCRAQGIPLIQICTQATGDRR